MMKRKKRFWAIAMTLIMCFGVTGVLSTDVKAAKTSEVQAQEEYPGDVIGTATINPTFIKKKNSSFTVGLAKFSLNSLITLPRIIIKIIFMNSLG